MTRRDGWKERLRNDLFLSSWMRKTLTVNAQYWRTHTYLAHSHKQAEGEYCREASDICEYRKQHRQSSRPRHAEQEQEFPADLLRQRAAKDLRRHVTVEESAENETLSLLVPVERTRLQQITMHR